MHRKPSYSTLAILRLVHIGNPFQSDLPSNNRSDGSARRQCIYSRRRRDTFQQSHSHILVELSHA